MVRSEGDGEKGEHEVADDQPLPDAATAADDGGTDDDRPRVMQRRHRRQLVRDAAPASAIDGLIEEQPGIDEAELRHQPRWGHGDHLDREASRRGECQHVADRRVPVTVSPEQPDEGETHRWYVDAAVVNVHELQQPPVIKCGLLHRELAREVPTLFEFPDRDGVLLGAFDLGDGLSPGVLPDGVEHQHS